MQNSFKTQFLSLDEQICDLMTIRDKDLPEAQLLVERGIKSMKKVVRFMVKLKWKQSQKNTMISVIKALRRNVENEKNQSRKLHRSMAILRKYHTFLYFHRYRRIIHLEVVIRSKDSI